MAEIKRTCYPSGELRSACFELNGKKEGECKEYYKSGTLYKIRNDIYVMVIDIVDYIYEDYFKGGQDGLFFVSFIYNNIIVYIQNDSEISEPIIEFTYVKSQIDRCDLNTIKKTFNFLNKDMYVD